MRIENIKRKIREREIMMKDKLFRGTYLMVITLFLAILGLMNLPINALAGEKIKLNAAPLNPAYTEYISNIHSNNFSLNSLNLSNNLGYVPSPFSLFKPKQLTPVKNQPRSSQLPSSYDLRTKNKLTSIRDQGNSASSWAFAAYGSLESNLKTAETADFSENNLKNRSGFDIDPNGSGNEDMAIAYLARWDGPVAENDDPYSDTSTQSPEKPAQKHVQEVLKFGYEDNYTDIKQALMKYGAVYTTLHFQADNYNSANKTYFYRGSEAANQAVDIVGWDDNFDRNKFANSGSGIPPENGAFIVRNSLGTGWGDKGYFYVSYYDLVIGSDNAVFNNAEPLSNYSSVYQYDPLGETTPVAFPLNPNTVWFANVFTANSDDDLSAVSFYTNGPNSKYEVWLYNYSDGTLSKNKRMGSGTIDYAGYHTVKLTTSVPLTSGSKFAVVVKLTTPGDDPNLLALEEPVAGYSSQAESERGQSFVSGDGSAWIDLKDTDHAQANVCLKAFTSPKTIKSLSADPSSITILQGETQSITVQAMDNEGSTEDVTSLVEADPSNSKIAVLNNGKLEAISPGNTTITISYLGKKTSIKVNVIPAFELQASLNPITVEVGKSVKPKVAAVYSTGKSDDVTSKVTWIVNPFATQNVSVKKGTLTGSVEGETKVTISYLNKSLIVPVSVLPQLTTLTATPNTLALVTDEQSTPQIMATYGKDFEDVTTKCSASSSKPSVASVSNGVITGGTPGTAVITYTYGSKTVQVKVTVSPKLTKLEAANSSLTIKETKSVTVKVKAFYSNGKTADVTTKATWTIASGGDNYISLDKGKITGLTPGTTQVNVSYQGLTATVSVTVLPR